MMQEGHGVPCPYCCRPKMSMVATAPPTRLMRRYRTLACYAVRWTRSILTPSGAAMYAIHPPLPAGFAARLLARPLAPHDNGGPVEDIVGPCVTQRSRMVLHRGHRASVCASAVSAWGSQKVIAMVRYSSMAVESSRRACSCWPSVPYNIPGPRWQWAWRGRMPSSWARARACW
jgi:hypothetical protein